MTKKMILSSLLASTMLLGAATASADEMTAIDSSTPITEVTTNPATTPSTTVTEPSTPTEPTTPTTPVDPTVPSTSEGKDNAGSLDGVPSTPGTSETPSSQGKDNAGSLDSVPTDKPSETPAPQGKDNAGSLDGVPAEKPKTTDEANEQGKSQIGTTSTSTGQTVQDVTEQNPVRTNTGAQIVSTRDGQVILSDGTVTSPEAIGAKTNADKTITVTKEDGSTVTLPHTGDENKVALGILGAMTAVAGLTLAFKNKKKA